MANTEPGDGDFLMRWSQRKAQARAGAEPPEPEAEPEPVVGQESAEGEAAPPLTDAEMPPLESLDQRSDYSGFLSPGVSETLRRKALAKLFHSPAFNVTDGLDDYAEDFTQFVPLGNLVTAEMRHRMEQTAKRLLEGDEEAGQAVAARARDDAPADTQADDGPAPADAAEAAIAPDDNGDPA